MPNYASHCKRNLQRGDDYFMSLAIKEAKRAAGRLEVPIGAVAVEGGNVIAMSYNTRETKKDPLGHAEIILIQKLARIKKAWRLSSVTIYVTCEPCIMCMGAMLQARIERVVYGCMDPKAGACGSLYDLSSDPRLNHDIEVRRGILAGQCGALLSDFFKKLRP